ncbi:PucR family transcriptional regulator [Alteribacillus sp. JSM 102045]|uniref:PucR family transcriptional regulator n=1 Tax=Alteribacillus sp. JSM 102045 TaxID=1562101 RepID=UPI0035C1E87B
MSGRDIETFHRRFSSLEDFADHISELLEGPVTIEDANHRLLAYSTHEEHTDSARTSTIIGRRVPEKVINKLWKEGIIPSLHQHNKAIHIKEIKEIGLGTRMAVTIKKNKEVLGYIWVLEGKRIFNEHEASMLEAAASKAVTQLQKVDYRKKEREKNSQELFWRLLTGDNVEEEAVKKDILSWFPQLPAAFSVIIFYTDGEFSDRVHKNIAYLTNTSQKVKNIFHTSDQNMMILLVEPLFKEPKERSIRLFVKECMHLLKERFNIEQITAGSGEICFYFSEVKNSYQKALEVIKINRKLPVDKEKYIFYHELGFYKYADLLIDYKKQENCTEPVLQLLKSYDQKNNTELFKSLALYLQCDTNTKEASQHLHIHVNTLAYRLKRIEELTGLDMDNPYQKLSLLLEISLIELNG